MDTLSLLVGALELRLKHLEHVPGGAAAGRYASEPGAAVLVTCLDNPIQVEGQKNSEIAAGSVAVLMPGARDELVVRQGAEHLVGHIAFDVRMAATLIDNLPPLLTLPAASGVTAMWRSSVFAFLRCEAGCIRLGSAIFSQRLLELLFIQALRLPLIDAPKGSGGWHVLLHDAGLQQAISLLSEFPERAWNLQDLAKESAMSRTVLVERFVTLTGYPPMTFLRQLRLHQARRLLEGTPMSIAQIAEDAGYGSESAFARSFKQHYGFTPGAARQERRAAAVPG